MAVGATGESSEHISAPLILNVRQLASSSARELRRGAGKRAHTAVPSKNDGLLETHTQMGVATLNDTQMVPNPNLFADAAA